MIKGTTRVPYDYSVFNDLIGLVDAEWKLAMVTTMAVMRDTATKASANTHQ